MKYFFIAPLVAVFSISFSSRVGFSAVECNSILHLEGFTLQTDQINDDIRICEQAKDTVDLDVDYGTKTTRSLALSRKKFEQYLQGIKTTIPYFEAKGLKADHCVHAIDIAVRLEHRERHFRSCEKTKSLLMAEKLHDLVRDLYNER